MSNPCRHFHVQIGERWYGHGKYNFFQCKDCGAQLLPKWEQVDAVGKPIEAARSSSEPDDATPRLPQEAPRP
jgi:hypothetical protein